MTPEAHAADGGGPGGSAAASPRGATAGSHAAVADARDAAAGAVFAALADPTRRRIVRAAVDRGTVTASSLAAELPVTRQAVAKHLAVLADAGLVAGERAGRETRYAVTPSALSDAMEWMLRAGASWDARLDRLERRLAGRRVAQRSESSEM